jgi:hypothetical protein
LPYPAAVPLSKYLASTDKTNTAKNFCAAFETMLTLAFAISYAELTSAARGSSRLLKGFGKASGGPLIAALRQSVAMVKSTDSISHKLAELLTEQNMVVLNDAVKEINDFKHGRDFGNLDYSRVLNIVGNTLSVSLGDRVLGRFDSVVKHGFANKLSGYFKVARGASRNFARWFRYQGSEAFSDQEAFIIDPGKGTALSLTPLMFWYTLPGDSEPTLALLDQLSDARQSFKLVDGGREISLGENDGLADLRQCCLDSLQNDSHRELRRDLVFSNGS